MLTREQRDKMVVDEMLASARREAWEAGRQAARVAVSLVRSHHNELRAEAIHDCYDAIRTLHNPYRPVPESGEPLSAWSQYRPDDLTDDELAEYVIQSKGR